MKKQWILPIALATFALGSCTTDNGIPTGNTPVTIKMTDAPANYDAILLNIDEIEILTAGGSRIIDVEGEPFDILEYRMGKDTVIASHDDVPSGRIQEIRLILEDEGNEIIVDGVSHPLKTPSGQSSGVKLKVQDDLLPNVAYTLLLDFDASKSIVQNGNGGYSLKPVIRAIPLAVSGTIKGSIIPVEAWPNIYAIAGQDTIGTLTDSLGMFYFPGVPQGDYKVVAEPTVEGFDTVAVENVTVGTGEVKDLGVINLATE